MSGPKVDSTARVLHRGEGAFGVLEVREGSGLRWLCSGGDEIQSALRLTAPAELVLSNHRYMLAALAACRHPPRILNLGFGGGAFERFMAARWPPVQLVSVEVDARVVALARRWFFIPAQWPVTVAAAADYLAGDRSRFDLVLCDIFSAEAHPACLADETFYASIAARLAPRGVLALNLSPRADHDLLALLLPMRRHFRALRLTTVPDSGNVVVLADQHSAPAHGDDAARLAALDARLGFELSALAQQFQIIPARADA